MWGKSGIAGQPAWRREGSKQGRRASTCTDARVCVRVHVFACECMYVCTSLHMHAFTHINILGSASRELTYTTHIDAICVEGTHAGLVGE